MPIRVLIIDQHEIMRAGIKLTCSTRDDLEVVGEAENIDDGCRMAVQAKADVAIVDPDTIGGLKLIDRLLHRRPKLPILVFTAHDGPEYVKPILASGAAGYLTKAASVDEIAVAIRCVYQGRVFVSHSHPPVPRPRQSARSRRIGPPVEAGFSAASATGSVHGAHVTMPDSPQLSGREREVLSLLADGFTNKQVAESLFLSVKTVETYRARIMKKHGLRDRSELVRFARQAAAEMTPNV